MLDKFSSFMSNLDKIRTCFCTKWTNLEKRSIVLLCETNLCFKYIFIKVLLIYNQRCSLKYINLHFNNLIVKLPHTMNHFTMIPGYSNGMHQKNTFFSYKFPLIIKILLDSQMYVITGVEFFSISLLISSVEIRNWKMSLLTPVSPTQITLQVKFLKNIVF